MDSGSGKFQPTRWSLFEAANTSDESGRRVIVEKLTRIYWRPVFSFLRRKGYPDDRAQDLTQGFFCEIVLGRDLIQQANKARGRFRSLLLKALQRYVVSVKRQEGAKFRCPEGGVHSLDSDDLPEIPIRTQMKPEDAFYYAWASDLLEQVLAELKEEYSQSGRVQYWGAFYRRVLAPILNRTQMASLSEVCAAYGISDETKASNMIITVKRRFRAILMRRLRSLAHSDDEAESEFTAVLEILSRQGAG
jgi:RNA polymerase sigma-70 factor (ECF subfamily)